MRRSRAVRITGWVVLAVAVLAGGAYVVASILGFSAHAAFVGQWVFPVLVVALGVWVVAAAVSRSARSTARASASGAGESANAIYLGRPSATISEKSADEYSAYPPEPPAADDGDETPRSD
ncbi:hypothetical protein ABCS02_12030 [Microbacterium sp. X-17]|uniref:hypothetical protein n=1 Tax=Microbacterium sp. X-17 TaxID=3144404 RepID=UPI0031F565D8